MRYGNEGLIKVRRNGRLWKLHSEFALAGEYWEFDTIRWMREVIKPGDCILDIGANVGQMTLEAALLVGPTGKVVAVEPAPGNLRLLHRHLEANKIADRVLVIPKACGASGGEQLELHVLGDPEAIGSGHNIFRPAHAGDWTSVTVESTTVDDLCREHDLSPRLIKIDVEGAELEVLRGCRSVLQSCRPVVQVAFHPFAFEDPVTATREIRDLFLECGYDSPEPKEGGAYELAEYHHMPFAPNATALSIPDSTGLSNGTRG
jgi:FkbM family methyltransferase